MTKLLSRRAVLAAVTSAPVAYLAVARPTWAATAHDVEMLNVHPENRRLRQVFFPRVLAVQPGDTVNFLATDRGHNSATVDGMIPEGAEGWDGKINEEVSATFEVPGFYGYQCTPHASVGMVGLIVVQGDGMMDNYEAAQGVRQRGRARSAWEEIWEEATEMGLVS